MRTSTGLSPALRCPVHGLGSRPIWPTVVGENGCHDRQKQLRTRRGWHFSHRLPTVRASRKLAPHAKCTARAGVAILCRVEARTLCREVLVKCGAHANSSHSTTKKHQIRPPIEPHRRPERPRREGEMLRRHRVAGTTAHVQGGGRALEGRLRASVWLGPLRSC